MNQFGPHVRVALFTISCLASVGTFAGCADAPRAGSDSDSLAVASSMSASLSLTSSGNNRYCASVAVKNSGSTPVTSWTVAINMNQSQVSSLRGATQTTSAGTMTVTPRSSRASIAANSTTSFTFCATETGSNYRPTIASVTGTSSSSPGTGSVGGTGGAVPGTGGAVAGTGGTGSVGGTGGTVAGTGGTVPGTGTGGTGSVGGTGGTVAGTGGTVAGTGGTVAGTGGTGSVGGTGGTVAGTGGTVAGTGGTVAGTGTGGTVAGTGGTVAGTGGTVAGTGGTVAGTGGTTGTGGSTGTGGAYTPPPLTGSVASAAQACLNTPMPTTGTTYYACDCGTGADPTCKPGDDTKDGKSPATAWQSFAKLQGQFATMNPGDTLAFCRGGVFAATPTYWVNGKCQANNPCTVRDYVPTGGSASLAIPRIVGGELSLNNPGNATHEEGYQFLNLYMDGGPGYAIEFGVLAGNDIKDVLLCGVTVTGYQNGMYVANSGPAATNSNSDTLNARITLRGSQILNSSNLGYLGTCDDCAVEYNLFDHNGDATIFDHDIYLSGAADGNGNHYVATNERVVGNQLFHAAQGTGNVCVGNPMVVHGNHDGLLIQGNYIEQDPGTAGGGCWGISVGPGYDNYPESFTNVVIAQNTVVDTGNVGIFMASCQNCTIEDNLVIQSQAGFDTTAISVHLTSGPRNPEDQMQTGVQVLNNTIYFDQPSARATGIAVGLEGTNYVVASNVVVSTSAVQFECYGYDLPASAYYADYNSCWSLKGTINGWEGFSGASLANWQKASGLDMHSFTANPMFKAAGFTSYDFHPATGSPLIGAGDPTRSATMDILGNMRPSPGDIGAYQH
jgi:parallel beta-helix repeat protein